MVLLFSGFEMEQSYDVDRPDAVAGTFQENKTELTEELGDVLGNLILIANKYDICLEDILIAHKQKLQARYSDH